MTYMADDLSISITKLQRFCTQDGPSIRTTVFFKGCPLRCKWCHNPETQSVENQLYYNAALCVGCGKCAAVCPVGAHTSAGFERDRCVGCGKCAAVCPAGALEAVSTRMRVSEIMREVLKDRAFYADGGGLTLSGGEPFMQGAGASALLEAAKKEGIHTAVETCGYFDGALLETAVPKVDLFLWDFKDGAPSRHRQYTGVSNRKIVDNLRRADRLGARIRLRCIIVAGVNDDRKNLDAIVSVCGALENLEGAELLPYHAYGGAKRVLLGGEDDGRSAWVPSQESLDGAARYLADRGVRVVR